MGFSCWKTNRISLRNEKQLWDFLSCKVFDGVLSRKICSTEEEGIYKCRQMEVK